MLSISDTDVGTVLKELTSRGIRPVFLVPTEIGMKKSIMDATRSVRSYLRRTALHDYEVQPQGPDHKVIVRAHFVHPYELVPTKASLYRPLTKQGDPRIWFYGLGQYASSRNLLAIVVHGGELYIANCSDTNILASLGMAGSASSILADTEGFRSPAAEELLGMLRHVAEQGPIRAVTAGDTAVGATLEYALGIPANASKVADFKGVELKSSRRLSGSRSNRVTLFSQVPDWGRSRAKTARQLLQMCGYEQDGMLRLYCTVSANQPNPQGLYLSVEAADLDLWSRMKAGGSDQGINVWALPDLHDRLKEKHAETFWVRADVTIAEGWEHFHYTRAQYTSSPIPDHFDMLLEAGKITLDYTLKFKPTGMTRDHGYLFKIHKQDLGALFQGPQLIPLV